MLFPSESRMAWESNIWRISMVGKCYEFDTQDTLQLAIELWFHSTFFLLQPQQHSFPYKLSRSSKYYLGIQATKCCVLRVEYM